MMMGSFRPMQLLLLPLLILNVLAATDFSVSSGISSWNQSAWSLTTNELLTGQYQSRSSLANG
jgi:hypothetical protein